jgi:hypothetical protein
MRRSPQAALSRWRHRQRSSGSDPICAPVHDRSPISSVRKPLFGHDCFSSSRRLASRDRLGDAGVVRPGPSPARRRLLLLSDSGRHRSVSGVELMTASVRERNSAGWRPSSCSSPGAQIGCASRFSGRSGSPVIPSSRSGIAHWPLPVGMIVTTRAVLLSATDAHGCCPS